MDYDLKSSLPITERAPAQSSAAPFGQRCVAITANPCTAQEETRWRWVSLLHTAWGTWGTHALALADQAVVSAASFLTTVVIARWTIPNELGIYSIGISLLVSSLSIQESLISLPYTIQQHRAPGTLAEQAGSSLTYNALLSALGIIILAVTALALSVSGAEPQLRAMTWALAGVLPFALLREFARRFSLAHLHTGQALILDSAVAAIQLAGLGWIAWTGRMSSANACAALGVACASSAIVWLCISRGKFAIRWDQVLTTTKQNWGLGKWLLAGQITVSVQGYMAFWLSALVLGTTATGVLAACMSVVAFANPLITGIGNILTPRAVLAFKEGGAPLRRQAIRDSLLLGAAMTLFCAVIMFSGEDIMRLLYHGKEYEGQGNTVAVLALALLASAVGTPASVGLATMERARAIVWASLVGAVITGVLVWLLMIEWGLLGAAYGFLAGNLAGSAARWVAFLTVVPEFGPNAGPMQIGSNSNSAMAIRVVQQFTQSSTDSGWVVEQLDEGGQAIVYAVTSQSQQPVWQAYRSLVIKLYKPSAAPNVELVRTQLEALLRLHSAVNGRTINGWKIFSPAPLYICESPLALVMTMVPGRKLNLCLEAGDNVTSEVLQSASHAVIAAMHRYWSIDSHVHGDLSFNNILCDIVARELSFVDLGGHENCLFCDDVSKRWYPASHDLAYMLYDTGITVKNTMGHPGALLRRQMFTHGVLQAFIETINPFEEKQWGLDEIEACARAHLKRFPLARSPRGLWHVLLKHIASRRIDIMLGRLKAEFDHSLGPHQRFG